MVARRSRTLAPAAELSYPGLWVFSLDAESPLHELLLPMLIPEGGRMRLARR